MNASLKQMFLARVAALDLGDPLWQGLRAVIQHMEHDTVHASSRSGQTADDRAFNDGRQSMALDILASLDDAWTTAHTPPGGEG